MASGTSTGRNSGASTRPSTGTTRAGTSVRRSRRPRTCDGGPRTCACGTGATSPSGRSLASTRKSSPSGVSRRRYWPLTRSAISADELRPSMLAATR